MKALVLTFSLLCLMLAAPSSSNAEPGRPAVPRSDPRFARALERTLNRLVSISHKRPFKLTTMNDALHSMSEGARVYQASLHYSKKTTPQNPALDFMSNARAISPVRQTGSSYLGSRNFSGLERAKEIFEQAVSQHAENSFGFLMLALIEEDQQNIPQANAYYAQFIIASEPLGEFDRFFIKGLDHHEIRRSVIRALEDRGVRVKMPERIKIFDFFSGQQKNPLMMPLIVWSVALLILKFFDVRFSDFPFRDLQLAYLALWLAYGLWVFLTWKDHRLNFMEREMIRKFFWGAGGLILVYELMLWGIARYGPVSKGYRHCPQCQRIILKLDLECSFCRKKIGKVKR